MANFIQAIDKDNPATDQDINKFVERLVKPRYLPLSYSVTLEDADLNTNADEVEVYAQPQFSITSEATVTIEEGIEVGTIVHTLAANGDDLDFAILSGYDSEKFTINGDGEISIDEPLDMEQKQYSINVEVEDGSNNTAKQLVNIFVKHVHNDLIAFTDDWGVPLGESPALSVQVNKNTPKDFLVTSLNTNADQIDADVEFSITGSDLFSIDEESGRVTVSQPLSAGEYPLEVQAANGEDAAELTLTINVVEEPDTDMKVALDDPGFWISSFVGGTVVEELTWETISTDLQGYYVGYTSEDVNIDEVDGVYTYI